MNLTHIAFIVTFYITVIGALNWAFNVYGCNLVEKASNLIFDSGSDNGKTFEKVVYIIVGLAGLTAGIMYTIHLSKGHSCDCDKKQ